MQNTWPRMAASEEWKTGPRPHDGLATPEEVLHLQEIAVAQDRLQRRDFGVGAQDENAVELRLVSQLAGVDLEDLFALGLLVFTQIPPVAGVANQSLIATLQLILQGGDNGFAVLPVFFRLGFVAADDVTLAIDLDLLDEELRLAFRRSIRSGVKGASVIEHDRSHQRVRALARAKDIIKLALFQPGNGLSRDHAAIGDHANAADSEALAETVNHRQQRLHIGGIARPHLGADRPPLAVHDEPQDHLLQIWPEILRVAVLAQRFAALAVEGQAGGVH